MKEKIPFKFNVCLSSASVEEAEAFINAHIDERTVTPLSAHHHGVNQMTLQPLQKTQVFGAHWGERVHIQSNQLSTSHLVLPLNGSIYVQTLQEELQPNDLLLLTPGDFADLLWDAGCTAMVLSLDAVALQTQFAVSKEELVTRAGRIYRSQDPVARSLSMLFSSINSHHEIFGGDLAFNMQRQWESMLFESCADILINNAHALNIILPIHIKRAVDWIMENINRDIKVHEVANIACCSRRSLEQGFKQFIGVSPARFINKIRLEAARDKLLHARGSVSDIASECGFSHLSYFTSQYKERYAETPSDTLKRHTLVTVG